MTKEQIIESGFITAFINEYFEYKIHSYYPDKDRLLYILCNSEQEKKEVTIKQMEITKRKISELGFDELSFAYLLSCKPKSLHNYIEPNKRFDFWLNRFSEDFEDHITDFDPITKSIYLFNDVSELSVEVMENESEFWEWYPKSQCPTITDFIVNIPKEADLLSLIEDDIKEYTKNEYWEFDFEEYERFVDVSKPIEILFNLSELLVQLNRLEMFNEFLEIENEALPPQHTTTENDTTKHTAKHYVLGYLIECNAKGESFPIGQKKELEKIGNEKMGAGKGNRFYKVFNEIVNKDLNIENNLIEIGGENWRTIVKDLSSEPQTIETYLLSKQL